jgi:hypothetical protein
MLLSKTSGESNSDKEEDSDDSYSSPELFQERSHSPVSPISPPPLSPNSITVTKKEISVSYKELPPTRDLDGNSYGKLPTKMMF